ncbi:MAG: hypothetical protein KAR30_10610, partial [Gammaproteobacteria bacterium]|nr:hypothetical protein [Gammaproteobacteria bacterium]
MLHKLYNKRRLISLYILPFLIGSWLTLICQGCFAMDIDPTDGQASNIEVELSDPVASSHCNREVESRTQDNNNDGLNSPNGKDPAGIPCQQLMLTEDLITDDIVSPLVEIADYSSPVLLYSY